MSIYLLSDTELHGLIDGQIEVHHRADILRRAASSTADRERIGSWQSQCDLIRSAFRGIDREPLPSVLDMRAPARLHAIGPTTSPQHHDDPPPMIAPSRRRYRLMLPSLAALVASAGLLATWLAGGFVFGSPDVGSVDEVLARRASGQPAGEATAQTTMPTSTIPDLASLGFTLTAAEMQAGEPASMKFHYRGAGAAQITLEVAQADDAPAAGSARPVLVGRAMVWHAGTRAYALAGDMQMDRLKALAPAVRDLSIDE